MSRTAEMAGEFFGPFCIHERLGKGGTASVFRATRRCRDGSELQVSLKRLHPHLVQDDEAVQMFVNEAHIASVLQHDNICRFYESGTVRDQFFISMEYIDGLDLRQLLQRSNDARTPPPFAVTLSLLSQLCDALEYAHNRADDRTGLSLGLVHRDVSPSNLIVTVDGRLKLIDLGIAKSRSSDYETKTGLVRGKFGYMAPEVLRGKAADPRADIYGVGVVAWELLTAHRLFGPSGHGDTLDRIRRGAAYPPSTRNPACAPQLDALVMRALARNPSRRWPSAASMRRAIHSVANILHEPIAPEVVSHWLHAAQAAPHRVADGDSERTTDTLHLAPSPAPAAPAPDRFPRGSGQVGAVGGSAPRRPASDARRAALPLLPTVTPAPAPVDSTPRVVPDSGTRSHEEVVRLRGQLAQETARRRLMNWGMGASVVVNIALLAAVFARIPARSEPAPVMAHMDSVRSGAVEATTGGTKRGARVSSARRRRLAAAKTRAGASKHRRRSRSAPTRAARTARTKKARSSARRPRRVASSGAKKPRRRLSGSAATAKPPVVGAFTLDRPPRIRYQRHPRSRSSRAAYSAQLCIDRAGRVQTVVVTRGPKYLHRRIRRYLRRWRFAPHRVRGVATPACFRVRARLRQWR
jgi:serine/threonine-protein kinase